MSDQKLIKPNKYGKKKVASITRIPDVGNSCHDTSHTQTKLGDRECEIDIGGMIGAKR